jgi:hypothetical protein
MTALLNGAPRNPSTGGVLSVDGTGATTGVTSGIPYESGAVAFDSISAISHYHQGLPFTSTGRIAVGDLPVTYYGSGSAPFNEDGRLVARYDPIDHYSSGVAYTIESCISASGGLNYSLFVPLGSDSLITSDSLTFKVVE